MLPLVESYNEANIFLGLIEYELNSLLGASHLVNYISVHIRFDLERYLLNVPINTAGKEACRKPNALIRIAKYLNKDQKKMLINTFFYSHFNYYPLLWMFLSKASNDKIEKLHK